MRWGRILSISLAVVLVTGACSGGPEGNPSHDRAAATSASKASGPTNGGGSISLSGRIAFDNFDDVWTIDADGTDLTRLTHSPRPEFDPSWSPDGTRIAYRSERSGDPEIWVMNADGSDQRRLTAGLSPAWSPDGSLIAFAGPSGTSGIITLIRPDGTGLRQLPGTEGGEYPSWSPDGTRIAFNSNLTGDHVMSIAQADGSKVVDLSSVGEGWQVDWSPDGRSILFTSHRDYTDNYTDVYVMRPDGSGVRRLTHQRAYTPAWSPDGAHIVFSAPGLFVVDPDGTGVTPIPTDVGETALPDWTLD
jgi:Tol biopolymer transport system component